MIEPRDDLDVALADRYHIEQEVGSGGMAKVYLAEDMKHHRKVAVKILRPELAAAMGPDRFLREIEVTARLTHPHILPLHDSGEAIGCLYYVMPYVKGESLRECLTRHGQLAIDDAVRITEQVASALDYAHRHGVVHRDIKPENILLHEGEVMVADFGIALAVSAAADERLTETGVSLGTPAYMSPEQICGGREIDGRSDIYSLACVLYEMLAGDPPFTASTPRAVLARHVTDPVPPITTVRASVPPPVVAAMTKALGKAPADRFESARAFAEALTAETGEAEPEIKSIVVLPFENLSPDPDQEYFSDGLTEEVISDLSKVRSLRVISRSSAMTFKGSGKRIPEIAEQLNVRYVLEGSVRKAGNSLRITAQLIDAENDAHLWADKYTGTPGDVFDLQETVARSVVEALKLELSVEEDLGIARRPMENPQAYDCHLRARHETESFTKDGFDRALEHLQQGLAIIGENALLYAGIGYTYFNYANIGVRPEEYADRAEEYARKALALDPNSAQAHLVLGEVYNGFRGDQRLSFHHLKRSLAITPDDPHTLFWLVVGTTVVGRTEAAGSWIQRLQSVDPLSPMSRWLPTWVDLLTGRYGGALAFDWHQLPPLPLYDFCHAVTLAYNQRFDDARKLILESVRAEWNDAFPQLSRLLRFAVERERERIDQLLTGESASTWRRDPIWSYLVASFLALADEENAAFDWLANAVDRGCINYPLLAQHDPFLAKLRGQHRFEVLMERVKYEWEHFEV